MIDAYSLRVSSPLPRSLSLTVFVFFLLSIPSGFGREEGSEETEYDLIVMGGTPGGIACAVRGAREGLKVLLINHSYHLGGFLTSGAGGWEAPYDGIRSPLYGEILSETARYYKATYGENSPQHLASRPSVTSNSHLDRPKVEPRIAEMLFERMVGNERSLTVLKNFYVVAADRKGNTLMSITVQDRHSDRRKTYRATIFVDAMYEGDLMAVAGVPSRIGRESRAEYGEPHAGVIYATERPKPPGQPGFPKDAVEGRMKIRYNSHATGDLLPQSTGEGDGSVMSYNYRLILTKDPNNKVPVQKPENYDAQAAEKVSSGSYMPGLPNVIVDKPNVVPNLPNQKIAWNGGRLVGPQNGYPAGDWATRERISKLYLDTMLSLLWYYQNDPAAPESQREYWKDYGLAADEFVDNNHVPYEIYVREARRLVGRYVFTEHDGVVLEGLSRTKIQRDSIGITDWPIDSVACLPRAFEGGHADGVFFLAEEARPAQIPYRTLLPQGVDNLLVPVALSASHVGWGPIRLEPIWMQTGEVAGLAAALAKKRRTTPAALDPDALLRELVARRFIITFFNDVDFDAPAKWVPAVEFLGTKGFFRSYDAQPQAPLSRATGEVWVETFGRLVGREEFDPNEVAKSLPPVENISVSITGREYAELLKKECSQRGANPGMVDAAMASIGIDPAAILERATACELTFDILGRQ